MVTIHDVAEYAQVSVGTVSRVLNENPSVRAPIREAVLPQHAVDAVHMLLKLVEGDESAPRSIRTESTFVPRASCGPVPTCGQS